MGLIMIVIGATGFYACGKTDLGHYLESKGFVFTSLSDVIRKYLTENQLPITRENLIKHGNELRRTKGHGILAKLLIAGLDPTKNYFVDSVRHQEEVVEFRKLPYFELWSVESPIEMRFARLAARNREEDPKTLEELIAKEKMESSAIGSPNQQIDKVQLLANRILQNIETRAFLSQADAYLADLMARHARVSETNKNVIISSNRL